MHERGRFLTRGFRPAAPGYSVLKRAPMKKMRTSGSVKAFVCLVFVLLFAAACSDFDEGAADTPQEPAPRSLFRSYDEALSLAEGSIALVERSATRSGRSRRIAGPGQCVTVPATRSGASQTDTLLYVFNFEDGNGFSVIAANRAVDPVLAVAEQGNYTHGEKTGADNFDFYMEAMSQGLARIPPPKEFDTMRTTPMFKVVHYDEHRSCDPLVPVEWGQQSIFGAYCSNGFSGCVATAIAQIMACYRFPTSITTTYTDAPHAGETISLDWDAMIRFPYTYRVSALLREIGQRVGMRYHPENEYDENTGSSAYSYNAPACMISFGYSCDGGLAQYAILSIHAALEDERPVYVRGTDPLYGGHAWVADGYIFSRVGYELYEEKLIDDGPRKYFDYVKTASYIETTNVVHYNWGWSGSFNGYFAPIQPCAAGGYNFAGLEIITSIKK